MKSIDELIKMNDLDKLKFYADYYIMIIELLEKWDRDASHIKMEYEMLLQRIHILESTKIKKRIVY